MALADIRREYSLGGLRRADLDANPIAQFSRWFAQASSGVGILFIRVEDELIHIIERYP